MRNVRQFVHTAFIVALLAAIIVAGDVGEIRFGCDVTEKLVKIKEQKCDMF